MRVKPLEWSDPSPPDRDYYYDHTVAKTAFGDIVITWKSWKEPGAYSVDLPFSWRPELFDSMYMGANTLDEAKSQAQAAWENAIISSLNLLS